MIYLRNVLNIIKVASFQEIFYLVPAWLFVGLPYLMGIAVTDCGRLIKILCDYKVDDDDYTIKSREDAK
mgnify:CR=1 FL=1